MRLAPAHSWEVWDLLTQASHPHFTEGTAVNTGPLLRSWAFCCPGIDGEAPYFLGAIQEAGSCAGAGAGGGPWLSVSCFSSFYDLNRDILKLLIGTSGKEPACRCRSCKRRGFNPWVGKMPWRRAWQPTPVFLPGESPRTEESPGYKSIGSKRVRHD